MNTTQATQLGVRTPSGSYDILLGRDLIDQLGAIAAERGLGHTVVIATDDRVPPIYAQDAALSLQASGFNPHIAVMPSGEAHKQWESVSLFIDAFIRAGLDRTGWVLAIGGGVVGDTAGFAASIYMRGVRLVQVPTTLLAMANSSIGGKVGVDHPSGKNLLGSFKHPDLVVADLHTLSTLPSLQIACGMAEIIKAGIIGDPDVFDLIEHTDPTALDYSQALLRAINVKRTIVEDDPYETGDRALLNLGHTFGHAIEACTHYSRPHGVAVAQGIMVASLLASRLGMCNPALVPRLQSALARWSLPTRWGDPDLVGPDAPESVYRAMLTDKKRQEGRTRLVLPQAIGKVSLVADVPPDLILASLAELQ